MNKGGTDILFILTLKEDQRFFFSFFLSLNKGSEKVI